MSQENVEIVRVCYEAVNRGDFETPRNFLAEDFELHSIFAPGRVFRGRNAAENLYAEVGDGLEGYQQNVEELIDAGDHVVALVRVAATGQGSGIEVTQRVATLWTLREGKVVKGITYATRAEALEAAGLSE